MHTAAKSPHTGAQITMTAVITQSLNAKQAGALSLSAAQQLSSSVTGLIDHDLSQFRVWQVCDQSRSTAAQAAQSGEMKMTKNWTIEKAAGGSVVVFDETGDVVANITKSENGRLLIKMISAALAGTQGASLYDKDAEQYLAGELHQLLGEV
jgi:hypothetical protein